MARSLVVPDMQTQRIAWLRRRFSEHNRLVAFVALLTLLVTAGIWYLLFAALYWLAFLFQGVVNGMDARPPDVLPALFIYSAGLLILITWLARKRFASEMPKDEKSAWEIAVEFLLAIPRATLAVWGNFSAWQSLDAREFELAGDLIERLVSERRIPLQQVPLEIPDPRDRMKILLALQLIEVLQVTHIERVAWLSLPGADAPIEHRPS